MIPVKKRYQLTEQARMSYHFIEFSFVMIARLLFGRNNHNLTRRIPTIFFLSKIRFWTIVRENGLLTWRRIPDRLFRIIF